MVSIASINDDHGINRGKKFLSKLLEIPIDNIKSNAAIPTTDRGSFTDTRPLKYVYLATSVIPGFKTIHIDDDNLPADANVEGLACLNIHRFQQYKVLWDALREFFEETMLSEKGNSSKIELEEWNL